MFGSFWRFFDGGMSVERLTDHENEHYNQPGCNSCSDYRWRSCKESGEIDDCIQRLTWLRLLDIEDILGDDYDIDHLRALVQADKEGRCVVLPDRKQTSDDGENALKSAMNTLYYHNNPVTRYIADAVAEKLTREAAAEALRRKQNE